MNVVMVLPKRRPGRPRKVKMEFADEEELPFNCLVKSDEDGGDEFEEADEVENSQAVAEFVESPKKKRGRPPMNRANTQSKAKILHASKKSKHTVSSSDDEDYTPFKTNKPKRSVGRPPKSAQKMEKVDVQIIRRLQPPPNGELHKRRPGRPRKVSQSQLAAKNDSDYTTHAISIQNKRISRIPSRLMNGSHTTYPSTIRNFKSTVTKYIKDDLSSYEEELDDDDDDEWKKKDNDAENEYDDDDYEGDEWISTKKHKQSQMKQNRKMKDRKNKDEDDELNSDDEISNCVPNGFKLIQCLLCGERMHRIHILRQHIQLHAQGEDIDDKILESAPIYEHLNAHKRDIDTPVMREFIMKEIRGQRTSEFYVILTEADQELHLSDSETDSGSEEFEDDVHCVTFPQNVIPRNIYKCDICNDGVTFNRRYKANFHQRTLHSDVKELPVKCYICGKGFVGAQLLSHHLKTQCERDSKPFPLIQRFWRHLAKANLEQMKNMSQARKSLRPQSSGHVPRDHECDVCHLRFVRPEHCIRHKRIHAPDALKFKCPRCPNRFFSRKDNLKLHMQVHLDVTQRTIKEKKILCAECGRSFNRHSNWVIHNRRHHTKEKPYACKVCGKCFVCSTDMKSHEQTHSNVRKHACNVCGKSFGRANLLSKHMTVHDDISLQRASDQRDNDEDDVTSISGSGNIPEDELVEGEEVAHMIKTIEIEYLE